MTICAQTSSGEVFEPWSTSGTRLLSFSVKAGRRHLSKVGTMRPRRSYLGCNGSNADPTAETGHQSDRYYREPEEHHSHWRVGRNRPPVENRTGLRTSVVLGEASQKEPTRRDPTKIWAPDMQSHKWPETPSHSQD